MELLKHERPISVDMKEGLYSLAKVKKKKTKANMFSKITFTNEYVGRISEIQY